MYGGADERQSERYVLLVDEADAVATKQRVRLVLDDEHNVGGYVVGSLVALLLEGDARVRLPAALHRNRQYLLLEAGRVAVVVHDAARDLHLLDAAVVDFLEREHEVALDRRVLLLATAARQAAEVLRAIELSVHTKVCMKIVV